MPPFIYNRFNNECLSIISRAFYLNSSFHRNCDVKYTIHPSAHKLTCLWKSEWTARQDRRRRRRTQQSNMWATATLSIGHYILAPSSTMDLLYCLACIIEITCSEPSRVDDDMWGCRRKREREWQRKWSKVLVSFIFVGLFSSFPFYTHEIDCLISLDWWIFCLSPLGHNTR